MEVFHLMILIDTVYIFIQGDLGYRLTDLQACRERRARSVVIVVTACGTEPWARRASDQFLGNVGVLGFLGLNQVGRRSRSNK
jgi:hypothetical protein